VPNYARPADGEGAERAIATLGNRAKSAIIRYLRQNPNVGRKAIAKGLGLETSSTVPQYLGELEEEGLLIGDPPRGVRKRGEWPVYRVNDVVVTELYLRLGQEIGEI
jgi:ArsR family transcriptional regulator, arsenate/arsenite/antimonite-responsive transcriptional repressor